MKIILMISLDLFLHNIETAISWNSVVHESRQLSCIITSNLQQLNFFIIFFILNSSDKKILYSLTSLYVCCMINYKKHDPSSSPRSGVLNVINLVLCRSNVSINIWRSISLTFIILNEGYWIDLCLARLFKNLNLFDNNHHMFCCCQSIVGFVALFYYRGYIT